VQDTLKKYSKDTRSYLRDTFWRYFCIYLLFCVQGRPKEWSHYVWRLTSSKNVRTNLRDFLVGLHFKCFVLNTSVNSISNKIIIQVAPPGDKINNQVLARHLRFNFECPYLWNQFAQFLAQFNAVILWTCSLTSYIGRRTEEGDPLSQAIVDKGISQGQGRRRLQSGAAEWRIYWTCFKYTD